MLTVRSSVIQTTEENIRSPIQFNGSFLPNLNLKFQQLGLSFAIIIIFFSFSHTLTGNAFFMFYNFISC